MCVVVDPPIFVAMFKTTDPEHGAFVAVRDWVISGSGKFVVGGGKYKAELLAVRSVLPFLTELERRGKIVRRIDADVDAEELAVKLLESSNDFDDPHLVALVRLTGCKVICTRDQRSHRFLRATKLYASAKERPSLYTRATHSALLCSQNIVPCCR